MVTGQLIPAPELAPPSLRSLTPEDRMRLWARIVHEGDAALRASFRDRAGSDAGADAALSEWLDRQGEQHAARAIRMLRRTAGARLRHGE